MSQELKSAFKLTVNSTKQIEAAPVQPIAQYKQETAQNELVGGQGEDERQTDFSIRRDEYLDLKTERKKDDIRIKEEEFGPSSSQEEDKGQEKPIENGLNELNIVTLPAEQTVQGQSSLVPSEDSYQIVLQLRKLAIENWLIFQAKQLEINKKLIPYSRISRLSLGVPTPQEGYKLKIGIAKDQELVIHVNTKKEGGDPCMQIFMRLLRIMFELKGVKLAPLIPKVSEADLSPQMGENALVFDRIYKKSQVMGYWEQRVVVIKENGLYSYRTLTSKPTMVIAKKQILEIQTKFELYKESLVVKLIYTNDTTYFGLPLDDQLIWVTRFAEMILRAQ